MGRKIRQYMEIQPYKSEISTLIYFQMNAGQVSELGNKEKYLKNLYIYFK